jgi:hypothetical protein
MSIDSLKLETNMKQHISLHIFPEGDFAVANTRGIGGLVLDLQTGKPTMRLQRDGYHRDMTPFPVAFFIHHGKTLLVHSTAWNRLDISDPVTGELLTVRGPTSYQRGETRPARYLDYFPGHLLISPNQEWIADDGWVWHPNES